jgi:AraC-like DNA-binding protein
VLVKPETAHHEEVIDKSEVRLAWIGFECAGSSPAWSHRPIHLKGDFEEISVLFEAIYREHSGAQSEGGENGRRLQHRIALALQSLLLLVARRAEGDRLRTHPRNSNLNPGQIGRVESAAHYFRENLRKSLSVAQVAAYHGLCPAHFSTLFHRHYGVTPRSFLNGTRLRSAVRLLRESALTVKEIAAEVGFVDAAHFCKAFKKVHACSPGAYRVTR